jgi:hypothetical protein
MNFKASCICRDEVRVLVILPALGLIVVAFRKSRNVGTSKLARLNRLNSSQRNSSFRLSPHAEILQERQILRD